MSIMHKLVAVVVLGAPFLGIQATAQEPKKPTKAKFTFPIWYLQQRNMLDAFLPDEKEPTKFKYNDEADVTVRQRIQEMKDKNEKFIVTATFKGKGGEEQEVTGSLTVDELVDRKAKEFNITVDVPIPVVSAVDVKIEAPRRFTAVSLKGLFAETKEIKVVMPLAKAPKKDVPKFYPPPIYVNPEFCPPPIYAYPEPCPPRLIWRHRIFRR